MEHPAAGEQGTFALQRFGRYQIKLGLHSQGGANVSAINNSTVSLDLAFILGLSSGNGKQNSGWLCPRFTFTKSFPYHCACIAQHKENILSKHKIFKVFSDLSHINIPACSGRVAKCGGEKKYYI